MNRTMSIAIIVAALASLAGYLLLPGDKQEQLIEGAAKAKAGLDKFAEVICSDGNDGYREHFIDMLRQEYPDKKIEDLCDNEK